jgi:FkbM family methyltransferase
MRALVSLALLCLSLGFIWLIASKRFRRLWKEIFSIRSEIQQSRKEIISLRKQLLLLEINNQLRLPARLPSQDGEEIILYNFFGRKNTGFYIELGAYNGVDLSNTYFFEAVGWDGLLIEPDPGLYQQCLLSRPNSKVINAAASDRSGSLQFTTAVGKEWLSYSGENQSREDRIIAEGGTLNRIEVKCLTLNEILKDIDQQIDFISLDVEGYEFDVLNGFDLTKYRPRVIVIEQSEFDNDSPASLLLKKHGYSRKLYLGHNSFYTHVSDQGVFSW